MAGRETATTLEKWPPTVSQVADVDTGPRRRAGSDDQHYTLREEQPPGISIGRDGPALPSLKASPMST